MASRELGPGGRYDAPIPESSQRSDHDHPNLTVLPAFCHEALIYDGLESFERGAVPFVLEGLTAGEAVLVLLPNEKVEVLTDKLGRIDSPRPPLEPLDAADLRTVGHNPSRILPALMDFVANQPPGRPCRAIAEPMFGGRGEDELDECMQHERLVNIAFGTGQPWRLLCLFDTTAVPTELLDDARREHPLLHQGDSVVYNRLFRPEDGKRILALPPLSPRPPQAERLSFTTGYLRAVRRFVLRHAGAAGLEATKSNDLVLAVNELAANSVRFGGNRGTLWLWTADRELICEVEDDGQLLQPLAGREKPESSAETGRGLWMVNQLCDLVQLRSSPAGTTVRVHMNMHGPDDQTA